MPLKTSNITRKRLIGLQDYTYYRYKELSKIIRVRYEKGVLKPLDPLDLEEGEEAIVVLKEDLIAFAQRIRKNIKKPSEEPSKLLSRERDRFA